MHDFKFHFEAFVRFNYMVRGKQLNISKTK